jgi:hypothetical protein
MECDDTCPFFKLGRPAWESKHYTCVLGGGLYPFGKCRVPEKRVAKMKELCEAL